MPGDHSKRGELRQLRALLVRTFSQAQGGADEADDTALCGVQARGPALEAARKGPALKRGVEP